MTHAGPISEEMFSVLDGEIELIFRVKKEVVRAGETVNIPSNAPHSFTNASDRPARLLCLCSPPGQEELFTAVGVPVAIRTTTPPELSKAEQEERRKRAAALAPRYRTEFLTP